jgi:hypothetical protein
LARIGNREFILEFSGLYHYHLGERQEDVPLSFEGGEEAEVLGENP